MVGRIVSHRLFKKSIVITGDWFVLLKAAVSLLLIIEGGEEKSYFQQVTGF
jgi:hypothetical protein